MAILGYLNLMKRIIPETQFDIEVAVKPHTKEPWRVANIAASWFRALPSYPKMWFLSSMISSRKIML